MSRESSGGSRWARSGTGGGWEGRKQEVSGEAPGPFRPHTLLEVVPESDVTVFEAWVCRSPCAPQPLCRPCLMVAAAVTCLSARCPSSSELWDVAVFFFLSVHVRAHHLESL